ncbi:MAG: aminomethyl-transferring glycine dehydrogenase subunit GcvPB [Chloroflexi bacterium]|nr:aminomethyl-transferring glycine dehydrogenase subunit GcvPB [Chloroflexota bacterium]
MERSVAGRQGCSLPACDVPLSQPPPQGLLRQELPLPEVTEGDLVRYFTHLSQLNLGVDVGFYPLGSCTMKYNPKLHEDVARLPGFSHIHPLQPEEMVQGALELMHRLQGYLAEITGLRAASLTPAAGAHGELTGMLVTRAYHHIRGEEARNIVLVPDSAHGTNPASAAMAGYRVVTVPSDAQGNLDLEALRAAMTPAVAAIMLTMPSTLGLFDPHIVDICREVHHHGGLVYGDGANLNALLGQVKLGELGFDIVHLNLHKTFSTPHGGGGPGAGALCVGQELAPFLPTPMVEKIDEGRYILTAPAQSIGRIGGFHGNFGILVRAYAYIRSLGAEGLRQVSEDAVLNANYLLYHLKEDYHLPYPRPCLHEVVLSGARQKRLGVTTLDIVKRLMDYGFHPPTIYFPLIVEEAMMIEPTETESKETLDAFIAAMRDIAREAEEEPEILRTAPHHAPMARLDEVAAARKPDLRWRAKE